MSYIIHVNTYLLTKENVEKAKSTFFLKLQRNVQSQMQIPIKESIINCLMIYQQPHVEMVGVFFLLC